MTGKRELRLALTGALFFILAGTIQGCNGDSVMEADEFKVQGNVGDTIPRGENCVWIDGIYVCN